MKRDPILFPLLFIFCGLCLSDCNDVNPQGLTMNKDQARVADELSVDDAHGPSKFTDEKEADSVNYKLVWINPQECDSGELIFNLSMSRDGFRGDLLKSISTNTAAYEENLKYCSFHIQKDLKAVINHRDTLPCAFSHFERTYNLIPEIRFQSAFLADSSQLPIKAISLLWQDNLLSHKQIKLTLRK